MAMVETKHPFFAAGLTTAVRRTRRAFMLGRGRNEALGLRLASAGPMGIVRLSALAEPPAHDALAVSGLAFGAVARMAARSPMIASPSGFSRVFQYTHGDRLLTPGDEVVNARLQSFRVIHYSPS